MAKPRTELPPAAAIEALADDRGRLTIRATPNAGKDAIHLPALGEPQILLVRVTAPPEDGRANKAILALLAKALGRPKSALELVRGTTGRDKVITIAPGGT